ncbi:hypothetical protein VTK56DRAFT_8408 [Thermocarpiscus australiensis]
MICIGIPVCRPLYRRFLDRVLTSRSRSMSGYKKQASSGPPLGLRTFGGSILRGASRWKSEAEGDATDGVSDADANGKGTEDIELADDDAAAARRHNLKDEFREVQLGINGPFTEATAVAGGCAHNGSEEEILGVEYRAAEPGSATKKRRSEPEPGRAHGPGKGTIQVTEEWRVDRS